MITTDPETEKTFSATKVFYGPEWMCNTASAPWVCPKCGRVYGPGVTACWACNKRIEDEEQKAGDWKTGCTTNVTSDKVKIVTNITSHEED